VKTQREPDIQTLRKVETTLPGVFEIRPAVFRDERGFFMETYHEAKFAALGITDRFVQDNHSSSKKGTLRGLHYQLRHSQAKLCRVVEGQALDVAVDIRLGSPFFGKWVGVVLSARDGNQIYIPPGFAHGFVALTDNVQLLYKCSEFYDSSDDRGIAWNDPDLTVQWGIQNPIVSIKDAANPELANVPRESLPRFQAK
jgi:dTDP-4-dehydrorhamnose 3,5-epimerase